MSFLKKTLGYLCGFMFAVSVLASIGLIIDNEASAGIFFFIVSIAILGGPFYLLAIKKPAKKKAAPTIEAEIKPSELLPEIDYKLIFHETDTGHGYSVCRNDDKQNLSWYALPRSEGLEAIKVAGSSHYSEELQEGCFYIGAEVLLIQEKDNKFDSNAVSVWDTKKRFRIGYIPKEQAKRIGSKLENGEISKAIIMWVEERREKIVSVRLLLIGPNASIKL